MKLSFIIFRFEDEEVKSQRGLGRESSLHSPSWIVGSLERLAVVGHGQPKDIMKVVGLLSGGKDSCFNLLHCVKNGHEIVALATLAPPEGIGV